MSSGPLTPKALAAAVDAARAYLRADCEGAARDFAEALVQVTDACVIGLPCDRHGGEIHGQEAMELRAGIEKILGSTDPLMGDAALILSIQLEALSRLLDHVDACDSLAFREAMNSGEPEDPEDAAP